MRRSPFGAGLLAALAGLVVLLLAGCARPPSAMPGSIHLKVTEALTTTGSLGSKTGRACTTSILGLVTFGNSGVREAMRHGGLTRVSASDSSSQHVLGVWGRHCTIVYGE